MKKTMKKIINLKLKFKITKKANHNFKSFSLKICNLVINLIIPTVTVIEAIICINHIKMRINNNICNNINKCNKNKMEIKTFYKCNKQ